MTAPGPMLMLLLLLLLLVLHVAHARDGAHAMLIPSPRCMSTPVCSRFIFSASADKTAGVWDAGERATRST